MLDKPDVNSLAEDQQQSNQGAQTGLKRARPPRDRAKRATNATASNPKFGADWQRDIDYNLAQPGVDDWEHLPPEIVDRYYNQAQSDFFEIIREYLELANFATARYKEFSTKHARWRFWMIIATGGLAAINVCATFQLLQIPLSTATPPTVTLPAVLTAIAALYAGALTVANNVENFSNNGEKAIGFRECRDLLLNRYYEYSFKWFFYVESYGKTGKACMNAGRLYRQLIDTDRELRQKLKEQTEVQARTGAGSSPKVASQRS